MKKLVSQIVVALMVITLSSTIVYADEPSGWAAEDIDVINQLGVYTEALSGNYQDAISRLEFTELIILSYKAMIGDVNLEATIENPFTDINHEDVTLAYEIGLIHGTGGTNFSPYATINREQMMSIYVRMMRKIEAALDIEVLDYKVQKVDYEDEDEVSQWAFDSMVIATVNGLIKGNNSGYLLPKLNSTKEQALVINYRVVRMVEDADGFGESNDEAITAFNGETGMVTADVLNFRSAPDTSTKANIIGKLYQYETVTIQSQVGDWYFVNSRNGMTGYVHGDYIKLYESFEEVSDLRLALVNYAKQYIGTPYLYGGTSLTSGVDCSGFTQAVYGAYGIAIRRTATQQSNQAQVITSSELLPGDLITYGYNGVISHIAMYVGDGQIIHATSSRGIAVTAMYGYLRQPVIGYRRVLND